MGADYIVSIYYGFQIPKELSEKDEEILENLHKKWILSKAEYQNYFFINESEHSKINNRLRNHIKIRFGEKIYPETYVKMVNKEYYEKESDKIYSISEEISKELENLSFKPEYNYYEYAYISY